MTPPRLSIITPTCGRARELTELISRLQAELPEDGTVEWLFSDDGGSHPLAVSPPLQWLQGPQRGPAANRNHGARAARGEWLLFLDDDCLPRPGFLAAYQAAIATHSADARVALEGATHAEHSLPSLLWEAPHNPHGGALISCNFAIPHALFFETGGFDERFPMASFEDTEFAARLERLGVRVEFVPEAAVDHPLRPLPPASKRARRWEARVISSYDFGATTAELLWLLPYHVVAVTRSRFRGAQWSLANCRAALSSAWEVLLFLTLFPTWVRRYRTAPRSPFWTEEVRQGKAPRRFGL